MRFQTLILGFTALFVTLANARSSDVIFAESVNFCGDRQVLLVEKFQFRFYPGNSSIEFSIVANSVQNEVDALINFQLTAYGLNPVNLTVNLCSIGGGVLCPLPAYNFNGTASYFLPDSFLDDIPEIAFYLPNLEAVARLEVFDQATGTSAACLEAYLSNGLTTKHDYVSWSVGAVVLLVYIFCLVNAIYPIAPIFSGWDYRLLAAVGQLQHMALTGFISVNYPQAFQAFTRNFAWTFGLIYIEPLEDNALRTALTTGGVNETTSNAISITSALQNILNGINSAAQNSGPAQINAVAASGPYGLPEVQGYGPNTAVSGLGRYLEDTGLSLSTAFITSLVVFAMLAAIMLFLTVLIGLIAFGTALVLKKHRREDFASLTRKHWLDFAALNGLRWLLVAWLPLVLLAIYSFRFSDNVGWAYVTVSAIVFALLIVMFGGLAFIVLRNRRKNVQGYDSLYEGKMQRRFAPVIEPNKHRYWWTFAVFFWLTLIKAAFVGAAQGHPLVQIVPLLAVEVIILVFLIFCLPFQSKGTTALEIILSIGRLVSYGLLIAFLPSLDANRIAVTVGIVILVIESVMFLVIFAVILKHLILGIVWLVKSRNTRNKRVSMLDTQKNADIVAEKGTTPTQKTYLADADHTQRPQMAAANPERPSSHASSTTLIGQNNQYDYNRNSLQPSMSERPVSGCAIRATSLLPA